TSITLEWEKDTDPLGRAPRFSTGNLLRLTTGGVSEYMAVVAADSETGVVTVRRGELGTAAIAHAAGTLVDVWNMHEVIRHAAARWAAYVYKRRGLFADSAFDTTTGVASRFPKDIPPEVEGDLAKF